YQEDALADAMDHVPMPRKPLVIEGRQGRLVIRLLSGDGESCLVLERLRTAIPPAALESRFGLTAREAEILAWVAQGKSNAAVAGIVSAEPRTVEKHLERIYRKLGVDSRFAAIRAVAQGQDYD